MNKIMPIWCLDHIEHWKERKENAKLSGIEFKDDLIQVYSEDEKDMNQLEESGILPSQTLGDILPLHEEYTRRRLEQYHFHFPAIISAGHHSSGADGSSPEERALFTLVRFCDELEAMTAKRQYNPEGRSRIQALSMIIEEAGRKSKEFVLPVLALCVSDEVSQRIYSRDQKERDFASGSDFRFKEWSLSSDLSPEEKKWRSDIVRFLEDNERLILDNLRSIV